MGFLRLSFQEVNGDTRTQKVPARVVQTYEDLTRCIMEYLKPGQNFETFHIHTNPGPCTEATIVYEDAYNMGWFFSDNAGDSEPLHVHLLPTTASPEPSPAPSATKYGSMKDLSEFAIQRITNGKDDCVIIGSCKETGGGVFARLISQGNLMCFRSRYDMDGWVIHNRVFLISLDKVDLFPGLDKNGIMEDLQQLQLERERRSRKAAKAERLKNKLEEGSRLQAQTLGTRR